VLFYLVLRGLDTIEDDMTIPLKRKEDLLRNFYQNVEQPDWTFDESGPNEKDRELLQQFDIVIKELLEIDPKYRSIIVDITKEMGNGMADYAGNADHINNGVDTNADFDLYCHYVAGLVGEGLTKLFVAAGFVDQRYSGFTRLSNAMGLFLQKINIIRDFREDLDDGRLFWPKQIWSKYCKHPKEFIDSQNETAALNCISEMTVNALSHGTDCLLYLSGIRDQSVFNFCAIPQVMAIATLALVFRNKLVFQQNVKIRKGEALEMMLNSTNLKSVVEVFRRYLKTIHQKNDPKDPSFLKISIECGRVGIQSISL
jgi:farnesyl-diphosphate farnesyltransferase